MEGGAIMPSRRNVALAAMAVTMLWSATAFGQEAGSGRHGHGMGGWGGHILQGVGLTDAQKAQIRQIRANHRPQFRALSVQRRTAQGRLGDQLYGTDAVTTASLAPLTQQIDQLRNQLAQERLQFALEVRNVLTPDQLAKAAQIRQQLNQLRQQMRTLLQPAP